MAHSGVSISIYPVMNSAPATTTAAGASAASATNPSAAGMHSARLRLWARCDAAWIEILRPRHCSISAAGPLVRDLLVARALPGLLVALPRMGALAVGTVSRGVLRRILGDVLPGRLGGITLR